MPTTGWGFYVQGSDEMIEVEELGVWLNNLLQCPVHYPAWGKPIFECACGINFPKFGVLAAKSMGEEGMKTLLELHRNGYKPPDGNLLDTNHARPSEIRWEDNEH